MRKPILILALALSLASCGGNQAANNAAVSEDSDAGGITAVNDTTAIDAATGEAANMAADVNYTFNEDATNGASNTTATKPANKASAPSPQRHEAAASDTNAAEAN